MTFTHGRFGAMQFALIAAVLAAGAPAIAGAQTARYPDKPVRIIVTNPPGGIVDIVSRMVAQKLSESLGQPFIVENRAGASGTIAAAAVAKAPADGSMLLMAPPTPIVMAPSLYKALTYNPLNSLVAVSEIAYAPQILVVNPALPVKTVGELIALARAKPGEVSYGSGGLGSSLHVSGVMFSSRAGVALTHVPYKGEAPAIADLLGGQVQMVFANLPAAAPLIKSGRLRALAVTSLQRTPLAPDLPTMAEAGLPEFEAVTWVGMFAPEGTPREIVATLNAAVLRMLAEADTIGQFAGHGLTIVGNSPEQFSAYIRTEIPLWAKVLKSAGVEPQ
jgi:tripartite-type tricarboxylate transporter receptor subunit TctC